MKKGDRVIYGLPGPDHGKTYTLKSEVPDQTRAELKQAVPDFDMLGWWRTNEGRYIHPSFILQESV